MPSEQHDDARHHDVRVDVHGGIHDGASGCLVRHGITIVGSATDCDLCLVDPGIAAHHVAIGSSDDGFVVRPMDGLCAINGRRLGSGKSKTIGRGDRIALGDSDVRLTLAAARILDSGPETGDAPPRRRRPRLYAGAALLALVVTAAAVGSRQTQDAPAVDAFANVNAMLESLAAAGDVTVSGENGVLTLHGVLADAAYAALERSLPSAPGSVVNRTLSASRLLEQVRGVFRTNGYHAELTYEGRGAVRVTNLDGENPTIRRIAGYARDDVSALASLTFAPVDDGGGRRLAVYTADPDKRLTTIVDGDTAYVATTDGGRYFVGSVLPGGLVLRDISAEGIQVDDNGEIHWLAL